MMTSSYETLSCEFEIYGSEIEAKKREYGEYLITLEGLLNEDKNMKRKYEIIISDQLDEYIERYGLELLNKPIETLYNIFEHSEGKFNKHDEIYEYIKEHPVTINGIIIFSSTKNFPKSFDIEINNESIINIKEANELNGENKSMTINIKSIECRKIRIINKGPNWDYANNYIAIKRIELLSNETKYLRGVFSTLVSETENHDPRKCPVFISASNFDFNHFYLINSEKTICTFDYKNSWFQIEFTLGKAIINGFRLKKSNSSKLKSYKIICTDDVYKSEENWIKLIEINEQSINEHEMLDIYKFTKSSPPIKFIRIIQTGRNWSDTLFLKFYSIDFFGSYI